MAGAALPQQCGNYELVREIGRGAGSEVWLGRHVRIPEHTVALKILLAQDDEAVLRFEREAGIAARLRHPSIARLVDWGFVHPYHYAAYELIDGVPLRSLLNSDQPLEPALALRVFRQTAAALIYAHSQGVIHRDISPGNIVLSDHGRQAVLIDFGIARSGESDLTISGALLGTRGYFAPEALLAADALDARSDLFSLGVVLYQMLSGRLPWPDVALGRRSDYALETLYPPSPSLRELGISTLPADFDRVLRTMLAVDPDQRYATLQAACDDVERVLARSTSSRLLLGAAAPAAAAAESPTAERQAAGFRSNGLAAGPVERALGAELTREPLDRAHARAEQLRDPQVIADLLNRWSAARPLRRRLLGRLARLHQVTSRNIAYYQLRALVEERRLVQPEVQPHDGAPLPTRAAVVDIWRVPLPAPGGKQPQSGRVVLPQTLRRAPCDVCDGNGEVVCRRCGGVVSEAFDDGAEPAAPPSPQLSRHAAPTLALQQLPMAIVDDDDDDEPALAGPAAAAYRSRPPQPPLIDDDDPYALPPQIARRPAGTDGGLAALLAAQTQETGDDPYDDDDDGLPPHLQRSGSGDILGDGGRLRNALLERLSGRTTADGPCRQCGGSGSVSCRRCDGSGELALTDVFVWSRRTLLLHAADDLPAHDEAWLARHCRAEVIYRAEAAAPRDEWLQIDEVAALIDDVEAGLGPQRRLIGCELTISIIPLSEITFDLGSDAERDRYRLAIYGFELRIPADWRLLDWGRIVLLILVGILAVLLAVAWYLR
jgi:eukaryotic-like serine/threonine-protein kinase